MGLDRLGYVVVPFTRAPPALGCRGPAPCKEMEVVEAAPALQAWLAPPLVLFRVTLHSHPTPLQLGNECHECPECPLRLLIPSPTPELLISLR